MPTYEYECQKCHRHFEEFQKMTDPPLKKCPVCQGRLTRLISGGAGLIFKGSGFYITDYKKTSAVTDTKKTPSKEKKEKAVAAPPPDQAAGSAASGKKEKKETKSETKKET